MFSFEPSIALAWRGLLWKALPFLLFPMGLNVIGNMAFLLKGHYKCNGRFTAK